MTKKMSQRTCLPPPDPIVAGVRKHNVGVFSSMLVVCVFLFFLTWKKHKLTPIDLLLVIGLLFGNGLLFCATILRERCHYFLEMVDVLALGTIWSIYIGLFSRTILEHWRYKVPLCIAIGCIWLVPINIIGYRFCQMIFWIYTMISQHNQQKHLHNKQQQHNQQYNQHHQRSPPALTPDAAAAPATAPIEMHQLLEEIDRVQERINQEIYGAGGDKSGAGGDESADGSGAGADGSGAAAAGAEASV
ncbi:uncharacterized protein LOC127261854 [Andrographis paniculata]|uniref:uncharacterized protein LOC127261854 n=1 Tax=Andrographis paniculata TaxID=175694 RepID=UPI0021E82A0D|nr:uncharacterized protein LOC127261854 [Andrographis paniculata]